MIHRTLLPVCVLATALTNLAVAALGDDQINARMMQMPAVSAKQIAFCYGGDIWIVPKTGGSAVRLSSSRGPESFPHFSPDGKLIAFTGNYEGNEDIYVMPVNGGEPRRITHHGTPERVLGWYPDGKSILFESKMASFTERVGQFFKVSVTGGLPEQLPVPYGEFAAISPDGDKLAYTPTSTEFATWKRYRGGLAPDIWVYDMAAGTSENVTKNPASDSMPMWHGTSLYFLSDRDDHERRNLWVYDTQTKATRQVTHFTDCDVHFPAIGPDDIVFEARGRLYLLDLASEKTHEVEVNVITDRITLRPHVENVGGQIRDAAISPTGQRVVFEARGDLFSLPSGEGIVRNLTESSGIAERYPAWSPDGRWIAYFSDRTGEYELTIRPSNGKGEEETLTSLGAGWRYMPQWSPDGKKIAFIDGAMKLHLFELATKKIEVIDRQLWQYHGELDRFRVSWSADSRWLTYSHDLENRQQAIVLYDTKEGKRHQVTSGYYDDDLPVFDPDGRFLYYRSRRNFDAIYSEFDNTWVYNNGEVLVAVPLRDDIVSPLAPRNEEEPMRMPADEPKHEEKPADHPNDKGKAADPAPEQPARKDEDPGKKVGMEEQKKSAPPAFSSPKANSPEKSASTQLPEARPVQIDLDTFEGRAVVLPINGGRFTDLCAAAGKLIFVRLPRVGGSTGPHPLCYYDLERRDEGMILDDVSDVQISASHRKLLVGRGHAWAVVNVMDNQRFDRPLATGRMEASIDPAAEWRQLFTDAWRIERDLFYDPHMHGVDWAQMRERYSVLLDDCVTRSDVNYVIGEMIGELNCSHVYRGGGDMTEGPHRGVGYLGCDFTLEQGAYRIHRILDVAPWDSANRSPLHQPGLRVKEGDWILAVNGHKLDPTEDPWIAFQGLADTTVQLTVNSTPKMEGAREILVRTIGDESRMRQLAWVESNRKLVDKLSGGKAGYLYVRNTLVDGQSDLYRQFRAQFNKPALVIDERWNSGGQIPDRFVELLGRRVTNYWGVRDGHDWQTPFVAHTGPMAMLVNGWSGSGGDCLPWLFRKAGLGPVIGQRTWGGLIGMTGAPQLIDGGHVTVPTFGIYDTNGSWVIEGSGVEPDIAVVDDPAKMAKGHDPQLERAIAEVMKSLQSGGPLQPKRPDYPNRAGMTASAPAPAPAEGEKPKVAAVPEGAVEQGK